MPSDPPSGLARTRSQVLFLQVPGGLGPHPSEVPLRFVVADGHLEILASGGSPPRWARALEGGGAVAWRIHGDWCLGTAFPVEDPGIVAAMRERFETRFGCEEVSRWFGDAVLGFRVEPGRWSAAAYHDRVRGYFDGLAADYDRGVSSNTLDRHLRAVSNAVLARAYRPSDRVLEVGAGTGLETLPLARRGTRVVATDISSRMLARLSEKALAEGLEGRVATRVVAAHELGRVLDEFGPHSFDGAFSDFGALNCEPELDSFPGILHELLRPRGTLVLGIWNRVCAAETLLSLAAGEPRRAFARLEVPVAVGRSRYGIPVYARSPGEMLGAFRSRFKAVRITGLPVFMPPYDFGNRLPSRERLLRILGALDAHLARRFPFNRFGDHFLMEMTRCP